MPQKNITCLLIDDDADDQEIFVLALIKTGLSVNCSYVSDGRDALDFLQSCPSLPDFVFLDLNMPTMDGRTCLKTLRSIQRLQSLPVIIYSTSSYIDDIRETSRLGATGFITKPTNINGLAETLKQVLEGTYTFANGDYYQ
jgi:CheY-like chemotaxis protein